MSEAGEAYLSTDEASTRSANFLREELESRRSCSASSCNWLGRAIRRTMSRLCGRRTGPWSSWGDWRYRHLSDGRSHERRMMFDPTNLTDGADLSPDPILLARSAAYSISYDHRSKGE
jgi:hypothetical protein